MVRRGKVGRGEGSLRPSFKPTFLRLAGGRLAGPRSHMSNASGSSFWAYASAFVNLFAKWLTALPGSGYVRAERHVANVEYIGSEHHEQQHMVSTCGPSYGPGSTGVTSGHLVWKQRFTEARWRADRHPNKHRRDTQDTLEALMCKYVELSNFKYLYMVPPTNRRVTRGDPVVWIYWAFHWHIKLYNCRHCKTVGVKASVEYLKGILSSGYRYVICFA